MEASGYEVEGLYGANHTLNESLTAIGGHIGFNVTPKERRKGYVTEMLKLVLAVAKRTGIDKVLLTCDIDNIASCKTVEKCGGKKEQFYSWMWSNGLR